MDYNQTHPQDNWDNLTFGGMFDEDQATQDQTYTVNPAMTSYTTMSAIQSNPQATTSAAADPRTMLPMPMVRWAMQKNNDPWHAGRAQVATASLSLDTMFSDQYRDPHPSDAASSVAGPQDSGYVTRPYTFSAGSAEEPSGFNMECSSIVGAMENLKPPRKTSRASSHLSVPSVSSQRIIRKPESKDGAYLPCPVAGCPESFKLQSELKKHRLKHEKPYKCHVSDCDRVREGFTTVNDLNRHKITRHQIFPDGTKSWRCAINGCRSKSKLWYRLDNFRQHIWRTHTKVPEEIDTITARSARPVINASNQQDSQTSGMSTQDSVSDQQSPSDEGIMDYSGLSDYDMMADGSLTNTQNSDWSSFPPSSVFDGYNGQEESSYRSFSDAGSSPFDKSSCVAEDPSSPLTFSPGSTASKPTFISRSFSPGQSSWPSTASPTSYPTHGLQHFTAKRFSTSPNPKVVLHHADSSIDKDQDATDLQTTARAILERGLSDDQLTESLYNLLESRKAQRLGQGSRSQGNPSNSREVSVSPSRGRTSISSSSAMFTAHGNGSKSDRAMSQSSGRSPSDSMRGRTLHQNDATSNGRRVPCPLPGCEKTFDRRSALEKHIRRHKKPYGCTFDDCSCNKIFGSKNDWKRHENSQHMQIDLWRCEKCFKAFPSKRSFAAHLEESHGFTNREQISALCRERRIGLNHSGSFWCGFCHEIRLLDPTKKGVHAWDERFNHIADHFVPDKDRLHEQRRIEDWLPPDGKMTKGEKEIAAGTASHEASSSNEENVGEIQTPSSVREPYLPPNQSSNTRVRNEPPDGQQLTGSTGPPIMRRHSSKRQKIEENFRNCETQKIQPKFRNCCVCAEISPYQIHNSCTSCGHFYCSKCTCTMG